jgi:hypothetical protein
VGVLAAHAVAFDEGKPAVEQLRSLRKKGESLSKAPKGRSDDGRIPSEPVHFDRTRGGHPELDQNLRGNSEPCPTVRCFFIAARTTGCLGADRPTNRNRMLVSRQNGAYR